jgi:hypothetical protein
MAILTEDDYPDIRAVISDGLDSNSLPDPRIALSIFQGEAEEEVIQRVGAFEELEEAAQAHARKAAIYLTAARIAPTITAIAYFGSDGNFDRVTFNGRAQAQILKAYAEEELAKVGDEAAEPLGTSTTSSSARNVAVW